LERLGAAAVGRDGVDYFSGGVDALSVDYSDKCSLLSKAQTLAAAHAARSAGNNCDFVLQPFHCAFPLIARQRL